MTPQPKDVDLLYVFAHRFNRYIGQTCAPQNNPQETAP